MKGFKPGIVFAVAIFLAIIVLLFYMEFLFSGKIETTETEITKEEVECKAHSDCYQNQLCMSINDQPNFCGCLDDSDCSGESCIHNKCVSS